MITVDLIRSWPVVDGWSVDPKTGNRVTLGDGVKLGNRVKLGDGVTLGDGVRLGDMSQNVIDLGVTDGHRKAVTRVKGVPWIAAGCRWFTLERAIEHWSNHDEDRRASLACMMYAKQLVEMGAI